MPRFSIVVPTRDRPHQLSRCLEAIAMLDFPRNDFEVIVVHDGTAERVTPRFRDRLNLTVLRQSQAGPAAARNRGAAEARGEFLAWTDDDCRPAPDWLAKLAARLEAFPGQVIGGRTVNALTRNVFSTASQSLIDYLYAYYNRGLGEASFLTSNNLAVPAETFRELGGFDSSFRLAAGEDRDFCDRWRASGLRMTYAPEAIVYHAHELTLAAYWRQHFRYGQGAFSFHQAREQRGQRPVKVEPASFYLDLLRYPVSELRGWRGARVAALMALAQAANVAGFLRERFKRP